MAQANSATAREPSMEEILASIRRIIEDSDTARRPDDFVDAPANEVDVFEAEAPEAVMHESARHESAPHENARQVQSAEVEAFRSEFSAPAEEPRLEPVPVRSVDTAQPTLQALDGGRAHERAPAAASVPERGDLVRGAGPSDRPRDGTGNTAADGTDSGARGAIISEVAGRQVAAAFEELNDAFTASRRRSYDEIAEEIMRPMLQEWLDNNLPLLVERLVREEIERVARGGTR